MEEKLKYFKKYAFGTVPSFGLLKQLIQDELPKDVSSKLNLDSKLIANDFSLTEYVLLKAEEINFKEIVIRKAQESEKMQIEENESEETENESEEDLNNLKGSDPN